MQNSTRRVAPAAARDEPEIAGRPFGVGGPPDVEPGFVPAGPTSLAVEPDQTEAASGWFVGDDLAGVQARHNEIGLDGPSWQCTIRDMS